jgi:hypothetical protein
VRLELTQSPRRWQAKKRAGGGPSAGPRGAPPSLNGARPAFLPQWALSAMARITGRDVSHDVNTTMPCLDPIHVVLSRLVPGVRREDMAHVLRTLICPCLACKGVPKVHESNGTFVALAEGGDVLYARCSDWSCCCEELDMKSGWMDIVEGSGTRPWVKLTAEKMAEFEAKVHQRLSKRAKRD